MKKLSLVLCTLLAACGNNPMQYADEKPTMDFYDYFNGPVDGWGTITDFKGTVTQRFHVLMDGKIVEDPSGEYLQLDETFTYSDGSVKERYWKVYKTSADTLLTAQAPEVPNGALGKQHGSAIQWRYKFDLPYNNKTIRVAMNDWMWMVDDTTMVNKNKITKFGIPVGELNIFFRKK